MRYGFQFLYNLSLSKGLFSTALDSLAKYLSAYSNAILASSNVNRLVLTIKPYLLRSAKNEPDFGFFRDVHYAQRTFIPMSCASGTKSGKLVAIAAACSMMTSFVARCAATAIAMAMR